MDRNTLEKKEILVIGGLGFIGSNIVQKLVSRKAKVTIFDACLDPYGWNFANIAEVKDQVAFVKGDTRDLEAVKAAVVGKAAVVDCAAQVSHTISVKNPFLDLDINCRGALNICEALREKNDSAKLVYAGTRGEIGKMVFNPITEDHPTNPVDFNGVDKLAAEKYYFLYQQLYGIPAVSLRINNTFGPRCQMRNSDYGIVNWFVRLAMENRPISLYGGGSQTRDYNYVEDVADAFVLAIEKKEADGNMYLLGSGVETPLLSMTKKIVALAQSKSPINLVDWSEERKRIEIGNFCVSIEKIRRELGWNPSTSLDDGLKKTIEFYRRRKNEYF